jgi:hypothetical protein
VKAEAATSESGGRPEDFSAPAAMMPGRIHENDPLLIQTLRKELRTRHYAIRTESAYVGWAERFMKFCGSEALDGIAGNEIKEFLTELAVKNNVAASTHCTFGHLIMVHGILRLASSVRDVVRADRGKFFAERVFSQGFPAIRVTWTT